MKTKLKGNSEKGFTLVELILYIALVSTFMVAAIYFAWDIIYGREKAFQQQIVDQSARIAMARIAYDINRSDSVQNLGASEIILNTPTGTTRIGLNGQVIEIFYGGGGPYNLSSNQVIVNNLEFFDDSDSENNSKSIRATASFEQAAGPSGQTTAKTTISQSIELSSQFNQARALMTDMSLTDLSGDTQVVGTTIQNTSDTDVVFDKLGIEWSGTAGGENLTEVQIGGGAIEYSGLTSSGNLVELSDYTLTASSTVSIDNFTFDSDMNEAQIDYYFLMADGSISNSKIFSIGIDPVQSCAAVCSGLGYSVGTCRRNASVCTQNGETHESTGDQFCTGGSQSDTCCCLP